jgi:hypothetical protein
MGEGVMRGKNTREKGTLFFWVGRIIFQIRRLYWGFILGGRSLWKDCYKGAPVAGSFGLGGQESLWNLGAREPERLCS